MKKIYLLASALFLFTYTSKAQVDTTKTTEPTQEESFDDFDDFDFSEFDEYEDSDGKIFCNNKVNGLSPTKLISIGYDFVGPYNLNTSSTGILSGLLQNQGRPEIEDEESQVAFNHGVRINANVPIISRYDFILNFGFNYWESRYEMGNDFDGMNTHPLHESFYRNELRTGGMNLTAFKPLNEKNFIVAQIQGDLNGNFNFMEIQPNLNTVKISGAALYGWKPNDNMNFAVGVTRTYRGGEVLHIPVVMYNHTYNKKWGVEALVPARAQVRRTIDPRTMMFFGYELEGNSYNLQNVGGSMSGYNDLELRRSEIRLRLAYEKSVYNFIWISVQAGMRLNYKFNVSESDDASYGDFVFENKIGNPFYCGFSINLVSP